MVEHLAAQLGIEDPSVVKRHTERRQTLYDHAWEIRDAYGYHPYEDAEWGRRFRTFLHGRAWTHAEGPKSLFDHAVGWLRRHRVLLPGVSVLARQVSEARKVAEKRLHATVAGAARRADPALPGDLVATLKTLEGSRFSELERLRRPPTRTTGTAFARALERVDEIGAYRLGRLRLSQIPPNRMAALARYALGSKAPLLERAAEPKRTAMRSGTSGGGRASSVPVRRSGRGVLRGGLGRRRDAGAFDLGPALRGHPIVIPVVGVHPRVGVHLHTVLLKAVGKAAHHADHREDDLHGRSLHQWSQRRQQVFGLLEAAAGLLPQQRMEVVLQHLRRGGEPPHHDRLQEFQQVCAALFPSDVHGAPPVSGALRAPGAVREQPGDDSEVRAVPGRLM